MKPPGAQTVPLHEFKARLSHYVAQARAGYTVELTSHRKVVARLTGVPPADADPIARMIAEGAAQWSGGKPKGAKLRLSESERTLSDMVIEDRG